MTSKARSEKDPAISPQTRLRIHRLVTVLLDRYQVPAPPVPVERMLADPLLDLWETNPRQISWSVGHGIYRYSPRMAQARLLYRTLADSSAARQAGLDAPSPATRREVKYFARCLQPIGCLRSSARNFRCRPLKPLSAWPNWVCRCWAASRSIPINSEVE